MMTVLFLSISPIFLKQPKLIPHPMSIFQHINHGYFVAKVFKNHNVAVFPGDEVVKRVLVIGRRQVIKRANSYRTVLGGIGGILTLTV